MSKSTLEAQFELEVIRAFELPQPQREFKFHLSRRWRFDFAYPEHLLAIEVDGGQWQSHGGRHSRDTDREKLNAAAVLGWRVLRYSGAMLRDPETVAREITTALRMHEAHNWLNEALQ